MKKLILIAATAFMSLHTFNINAQAFDKSSKLITIALGMGDMIHVPVGTSNPYTSYGFGGYNFNRTVVTGQLSVQGEFAVHKYVGVGFAIGIGGRAQGGGGGIGLGGIGFTGAYGYWKEVNIPIAVLANFHFYQLIADKKGGNLHADKLDVYAGITAGSGVAIHPYKDNATGAQNFNDVLAYGGPHAGVNYYFTPKIGINGEVGWGVTVIHAGLVIKL